MQLKTTLRRIWNEEEGQALTEYGLIMGLIAVVCVGALTTMGGKINTLLGTINGKL
ncbi:Flp/Fap pilin component [compost metagenome]